MISVIIPHFNQPEQLDRCLASLQGQDSNGQPVEILVVDNGSHQMPRDVVAKYPDVRLLQEVEPGPGPARNFGVTQSKGEILAFIDADCVAAEGWLAAIAKHLGAESSADILGGDVRILHKHPERPDPLEAYESEFAFRMEHYIKKQGFTGTGNLATRRAVMLEVGPFGGIDLAEDRDWGQRARAKGYAISWVPDMLALHPARQDFSELARKWDRHTAHDFALYMARPLGRLKWGLRSLAMALSPLGSGLRVLRSTRIKGGISGKLKALAVLTRIRLYRSRKMLGLLLHRAGQHVDTRWRDNP